MRYRIHDRIVLMTFAIAIAATLCNDAFAQSVEKQEREFRFNYGATIKALPKDAKVRVWVPIPASDSHQSAELIQFESEGTLEQHADEKYGNKIGYFETTAGDDGQSTFKFTYQVARKEAGADGTVELSAEQKESFLAANRLVPIDGRPTELLDGEGDLPTEPTEAAAKLYDVVEQHMKYDKSKPGYGNGDSVWACDSKTGNCTDFHSLFISLARSKSLPARFEIGFPLPTDKTEGTIGGYHCWAWFFAKEKGWTPVDISEADKHPEMKSYYFGKLTPDRIAFSTGRDIKLVPESSAGPLNYFVYPHIEVDGKQWPKENIDLSFSFKDIKSEAATPESSK